MKREKRLIIGTIKMSVGLFLPVFLLANMSVVAQDWKTSIDSGDASRARKDIVSAILWYEKAKTILAADSMGTGSYGVACRKIAETYTASNAREKAIEFSKIAREEIKSKIGKNNVATITLCDYLAQLYFVTNKQQAEQYFIEAKDIRLSLYGAGSIQYSISCNMLGGHYSTIGQYEQSLHYHQLAKNIRGLKLGKDHPDYAQSCNNMGVCYWYMGEYEKAEALALEAKSIREKLYLSGRDSAAYAFTCANLGNIYRDMGQYEKAEKYYMLAKDIRQRVLKPNDPSIIQITNSVADINSYMGRNDNAERFYLEARSLCEKYLGVNNSTFANNSNNLADLYHGMGRYKEAEKLFLEAKAIWDETLDPNDYTNALNRNSLGNLYFQMGELEKAEHNLNEARAIWDTANDRSHPFYSKNLYNLARVKWNQKKLLDAKRLYSQAFANEYAQVKKLFRFTNDAEKQKYIDNVISSADENMSFYFKNEKPQNAGEPFTLALSNKALILASSRELREIVYEKNNVALQNNYKEWITLKQRLANIYIVSNGSSSEKISLLESQADSLEQLLSRSSSEFRLQKEQSIAWKEIRKQLKTGEAAIEFAQFQLYNGNEWTDSVMYVALLLRKELVQPMMISLFEQRQLDSILRISNPSESVVSSYYTRGIKKGKQESNGRKMYELVWRPIEKHLGGIKTVYFSPDGLLHKVAFAALTPDSTRTISDRLNLVQLNSTAMLLSNAEIKKSTGKELVLMGGIDYGNAKNGTNAFAELPATATEIKEIEILARAAAMPIKLFVQKEATETAFKKLTGEQSPTVMHVATHGFFFKGLSDSTESSGGAANVRVFKQKDNPLFRSGLVFAGSNASWNGDIISESEDDGILTAYEVSNMHLPNTKLMVLSACETALGDIRAGEGVFGLQRAFKLAGVNYLLMSLWEVPDLETAEFMQLFYANLFKDQTVLSAFQGAQKSLKTKYRKEPYKWAAWILVR